MEFDELDFLRRNDPAWRLTRVDSLRARSFVGTESRLNNLRTERTQATARLLSEQLRTFLDDQVWLEKPPRDGHPVPHRVVRPAPALTFEFDGTAPCSGCGGTCGPEERVEHSRPPSDFAGRYRFRQKPACVRFCRLSGGELAVRVAEPAVTPPAARTVFVVENENTHVASPPVEDAVIFGEAMRRPGRGRPAVTSTRTGFAIMNSVHRTSRGRSMLMDRATLLAHEGQWVNEPNPTNEHLEALLPDEADLYTDLVEGALGSSVRLEQERISYAAIREATRRYH
ncbi:hypothetical protein GCM10027445_12590 [Amycolatopsis endophytica]|uniref:Wadjet protein JetD C-terminal domain-containing protein n=1 Tax=Amycolatopsis endophytica TaxID=860233 RepID=A0A853B443_9PSEU|nr:Wadjet anti-phage system protein JetD domain-containing protein [Amycolatopsis endophytica]NYI89396.1 hypothetical protein [Amycolatopsis endophytica]